MAIVKHMVIPYVQSNGIQTNLEFLSSCGKWPMSQTIQLLSICGFSVARIRKPILQLLKVWWTLRKYPTKSSASYLAKEPKQEPTSSWEVIKYQNPQMGFWRFQIPGHCRPLSLGYRIHYLDMHRSCWVGYEVVFTDLQHRVCYKLYCY